MARYAGLTDDPERRKREHGNPPDWWQRTFSTEREAPDWEKDMLARGHSGDTGGAGWHYGYTFSKN